METDGLPWSYLFSPGWMYSQVSHWRRWDHCLLLIWLKDSFWEDKAVPRLHLDVLNIVIRTVSLQAEFEGNIVCSHVTNEWMNECKKTEWEWTNDEGERANKNKTFSWVLLKQLWGKNYIRTLENVFLPLVIGPGFTSDKQMTNPFRQIILLIAFHWDTIPIVAHSIGVVL